MEVLVLSANSGLSLLFTLLIIFSHFDDATSVCSTTAGCYPREFDILENMARFPARSIQVSSVCGENSTTPVQYMSLLGTDFNTYQCTSASLQPINMVDNDEQTYWQSNKMYDASGAGPTPQYVVFNFTDKFLFYEILIDFAVPHLQNPDSSADARPEKFSIEKLEETGMDWVALHHFARDCGTSFPGVPVYDPFDANRLSTEVYCEEIPTNVGPFADGDNFVEFNPGFTFYTNGDDMKNNMAAISHLTTSAIRVSIQTPASSRSLASYVAIKNVLLKVSCLCSGHADTCGGPNNATCECQHSTTGQGCEECLPLYNNRQWQMGTTTDAGACQLCPCNDHASSCTFNEVKGHGVCTNCTDNTSGDFCDTCQSGFYVNPDYVNRTDPTASDAFCLECNCNPEGTLSSSLSTCDVTSGQCSCKERVTGRDCGVCQDTFWGLSGDNTLGCNACSCNPIGSLGSINMCDKTTGTCMCKDNVEGSTCDTCKPYTFGFSSAKPEGCTPCDCDPGASLDRTCDLTSGQCSCRSNIGGRDCRTPVTSYYVPRLDAIILEPEYYTTENIVLRSGHGTSGATVSGRGFVTMSPASQIEITFTASLSGQMNVVVRYENATQDLYVFVQGKLTLESAGSYSCNGQTIQAGQELSSLMYSGSRDGSRGGGSMGAVCLNAGSAFKIQLTNQGAALLIDSIVFVPETAPLLTTVGDRVGVDNITRCTQDAVSHVRSIRETCAATEYSLMAAFFNGAVACSCTGGALSSTGCNPYGGECNCLSGVLPPDCTQCRVDSYQLSTSTGCIACGCNLNGSVTDHCDVQGVCQCLPNVQGDKCDSCLGEHYGLYTGKGCSPCQCDVTYSLNNICDDYGMCSCLPGVAQPLCQACMDGYYNLTTTGCTQCACNPEGSTHRSCDVVTGGCQCLPSVEGSICDTCKTGTYGLGNWHPDGCIPCFCWEHGHNCTSAPGWFDAPVSSTWPLTDPTEVWYAENSEGMRVNVLTIQVDTLSGQRSALSVDSTQTSTLDVFYIASEKFLGNHKSSYGRYLTVTLKPSAASSSSSSSQNSTTTSAYGEDGSRGDVVLDGTYSDYSLVYKYRGAGVAPADSTITTEIPLRETSWEVVYRTEVDNVTTATVNNATYNQFMTVLHSLASIKIRAYIANTPGSAMDLLSITLDNAVDGSLTTAHTGVSVNNVEMCDCELAYTDSSCQQCVQNYKRVTINSTNPSTECEPCECNNHGITQCDELASPACSADVVRSCDQVTGICTCQHNTGGDYCEVCLTSYYGDATVGTVDDCLPCACPGLIVANDTNVFATSCSLNTTSEPVCEDCQEGHAGNHCEFCVDGYYGTPENASNAGGACLPCECNGRADTCDTRTGECVACRNNTAGQTCDICAPGYFGDAMTAECQPCTCQQLNGSTGECDHVTGECVCLPYVSGPQCDLCDDGTYNLTAGVGCQPCDCFMNGSLNTVCDKESGQCPCRNLVQGRRCDECQPGYWNINTVTGCDPCQCNTEGTAKDNGTTLTSCDVMTGQCTCALPGIVGRTCDMCSPVSKYEFEYVALFQIGEYPNCELCGECFDSWASRIEEVGQDFNSLNGKVVSIWTNYDNQSSQQISEQLNVIEEKINRTAQSLNNFEDVASQLQELHMQFSEALSRQDRLSTEVDMLSQTEESLRGTVMSLVVLGDMVELTNVTTTSLSNLRQQFDELAREAEATARMGNTSWAEIQSLAFIVASPEDRERQLREQADRLMQLASVANQTLILTRNLYQTTFNPGVSDKARQLTTANEKVTNVTGTLVEVRSIIQTVRFDVDSASSSLNLLLGQSATERDNLLQTVTKLQEHVANASRVQAVVDKLFKDATNFKTVAEKAEETIMDSMTSVLEGIASLEQAQTNLVQALTQSTTIQGIPLPSKDAMDQLVGQIANATVSTQDVEALKVEAQQALFIAEESVKDAQRALTLARELHEEVDLMQSDVMQSRDLRVTAQGLRMASDNLNNSINAILQAAQTHSNKVDSDVATVIQSAENIQAQIRNLTACLVQKQLDVSNALTSASQLQERAQAASDAQVTLLNVMADVNAEEGEAGMSEVLANLTQADSALKDLETNLEQLEMLAELETVLQELTSQNQEISDLDLEITQLTTELDTLLLSLQESGSPASCS